MTYINPPITKEETESVSDSLKDLFIKDIKSNEKLLGSHSKLSKRLIILFVGVAISVIASVSVLIYVVTSPLPTTEADIIRYKNSQNILLIRQQVIIEGQKKGEDQRLEIIKRLDKMDSADKNK